MYTLKLFGNKIAPACRHCTFGYPTIDNELVLCVKRGSVAPDFACRHYQYDPIMRVPRRPLQLERFDETMFQL